MKEKKYDVVKGEVLVGSALLKKSKSKFPDRVQYMLDNMHHNKAYINYKEKNNKIKKDCLDDFKKKYKKYRIDWESQPSNCIGNKYNFTKLIEEDIRPLCVDIETAAICDLACPFCFREFTTTPDKIINEEFCYNIIDQVADLKIPSIKFNWRGEPLLHPKLPNFIKYAKEKGILETIINTNATNLNTKTSEKLIKAGLDFIIYSFDGGSKETYEKMRPGRFKKNTFDHVYENIKNFKIIRDKIGSKLPYTKIQMILTKDTFGEQESFFDLFTDYVDDVSLSQYTERGGKLSDLDEDGLSQYYHELKINNLNPGTPYMRDAFGNLKISRGRKPCEQPFQRILITYEGRVAMCCYDWGATYPVGYMDETAYKSTKDYEDVMNKVKENKKGFELLSNIKMPKIHNDPEKTVSTLKEIWYGNEINKVRNMHIKNEGEKVSICKHCSFKDVYDWIEK
ncbi:MAG: Coenzyme PQQ synthesis protein E [Alphaproteobacteria bacterium MarineAlpha5_Bin9]|nr:MAG: Coenzyme PQQ synthesis protein E [Alphaproteobacteria bacterium MarineAlpha5_Bin9]